MDIPPSPPPRTYEIILLGASGYTGRYTAEYITTHLPTDLKWAVAGRSGSKLHSLIEDITPLNSDRYKPYVEICTLDPVDLDALASKTKVLINAVGPYHLYAEPVVKACAENGTHYIDCTGEVPWVRKMLLKYESKAKETGAIIIPQSGFESAPSDLLVYAIVSHLRKAFGAKPKDVVGTMWNLNTRAVSGGTLATTISLFSAFSLSEIRRALQPWSLASKPGNQHTRPSLWTLLTGLRRPPQLGLVTSAITGTSNAAIVDRSASLLQYGHEFRYQEYSTPRNWFTGIFTHWALIFGGLLFITPPIRWLISKVVYAPGDGPSRESTKNDSVEMRAVAESDKADGNEVVGKLNWKGNMYDFTGALLATGAHILARDAGDDSLTKASEVGGGFCTPAMLGDRFIEEMDKCGLSIEATST